LREKLLKNWDSQITLIAHGEHLKQSNEQIKTATAQCHGTYKNSIYCYLFRKKPTFLLKEPAMF
jgi:hypothetical protein